MYFTQSLHRGMQLYPDKPLTCFGERRRSFKDVGDRVARLAGALRGLGFQTGESAAILALNSDRFLEYFMAVPWAGGVLNPCNIRWSPAEILYSLEDSGSTIMFVDETFRPLAQKLAGQTTSIKAWIYCGDGAVPVGMHGYEQLLSGAAPIADAVRRGDDLLGLFYTGGTTGHPKGVMVSHNSLGTSYLSILAEGLAPKDAVYLHAAPMFHLADLGMAGPHWLQGNTHSFIPAFSPEALVAAVERDRVTHMLLVPTMIQMLIDHPVMGQGRDLSSLRCICYGASAMSEALLNRAIEALPGVEFAQAYGMTELAPLATVCGQDQHKPGGKLGSAGRASYCTEVRIVDPNGNEVPRGTVGEVIVRGANVMTGYWKKPELTASTIRDGWMHTGDGAYMDEDGYIFVVDRLKDMIITGGENVYSAEVESALAKHPAVMACAVIGIPSAEWGESVHAVVVLRPGNSTEKDELIAHCKELIAGYKCPRSIDFVEALPLSGAGKILKTTLREPYWSQHKRGVN
jgi:acyl-CoA synthetase (AMP-forming)/AMP-acid ligase II